MASWEQLAQYIRTNAKIHDEQEGVIALLIDIDGSRSQLVYIMNSSMRGGEPGWVQIESPIGMVGAVDLSSLLEQVRSLTCGGLSRVGDIVTLRHAVMLADMSTAEFERPLHAVVMAADAIEKSISIEDAW